MNTQLVRQLKYLAVIFCGITAGVMLMAFTARETARAAQLEKLYLLQRNRADQAEYLIDEIWEEYPDFGDTVAEGDNYCNWQQATELCDKYDARIVNEKPNY